MSGDPVVGDGRLMMSLLCAGDDVSGDPVVGDTRLMMSTAVCR